MINREDIIKRLKNALEPLQYVHAFWLEGSDANDTADEYSDIDFWADIDDEMEQRAIDEVETALSCISEIDYRYIVSHNHPKIRQRVYHLANSSEYLMLDFCWQLHSRPAEEYTYVKGDMIECVKMLFDKSGIIQFKDENLQDYVKWNEARLNEAKYRYTQHCRVMKYVRRNQYPEAYAYYNRYVVDPLIDLLRLIYTPAHADYYLVHISHHIPKEERLKLEHFLIVQSLEDIEKKIFSAKVWFEQLLAMYEERN